MLLLTPTQRRWVTYTVLGEAHPNNNTEMAGVAASIMNRSVSGRFPSNPAVVALQHNARGIYQYSTWNPLTNGGNNPTAKFSEDSAVYKNAERIVAGVFAHTIPDPTNGATHYYAPAGMPGGAEPYRWSSEAPLGGITIGGTIFAKKSPEVAAAIVNKAAAVYGQGAGPEQTAGPAGASAASASAASNAAARISSNAATLKSAASAATPSLVNNFAWNAAANPKTNGPTTRSVMSVPVSSDGLPIRPGVGNGAFEGSHYSGATYTPAKGLDVGAPVANLSPPSGALDWAGLNNFKYNPGNGQGEVALPTGVRPNTGYVNTNFSSPAHYDSSSVDNNKDQSRLTPTFGNKIPGTSQQPMAFVPQPRETTKTYFTYPEMSAGDKALAAARTANPLGGPDGLSAADFAPTPVVDPITKHVVQPMPHTVVVAQPAYVTPPQAAYVPPPPVTYNVSNGYIYAANPSGGYTRVGSQAPNLTPAQLYDAANGNKNPQSSYQQQANSTASLTS